MAGQQVVQKVVSAVTAGISGVVNSISSNGEDQPPLPGPNGLPALPGQAGFVAAPPPGLQNSTAYGAVGQSRTPAVVGGGECLDSLKISRGGTSEKQEEKKRQQTGRANAGVTDGVDVRHTCKGMSRPSCFGVIMNVMQQLLLCC